MVINFDFDLIVIKKVFLQFKHSSYDLDSVFDIV